MVKRRLSDLDVHGQRVLVRVDFNVPIEEQGVEAIASYDQRLRATLPTIRYLLERDCRVILCSHLGRPEGEVVETLRLAPVGNRLAVLLGRPVRSLKDCIGWDVVSAVGAMVPGEITLLENLRFHSGEEKNAAEFGEALATLADRFVMDAFAVAHRSHASTVGLTQHLPSAMGLLVQREVEALGQTLEVREDGKPLAALLGGAKVSDKIMVLENLLDKLDHLFIGGGMSVTFLHAVGYRTGASSVEGERLEFAREIMARAVTAGVQVHLPMDVVVANQFAADAFEVKTVPVNQVPEGWFIMDIGNTTARLFSQELGQCKTIVWNGPMGVFEMPRFSLGTRTVAEAIAGLTEVTSVVGGGSTAEVVEELGLMERMTHVSTGGGASLKFLEGKELPGIAALPDA
ncbi:MAG: phosphoglycerate kinase [Dehalococcoidia bacterium]|jgi:phosphoglycerate kinase|nr:phosphoglycerate kinase [Dehalococcoidia bacterium]MDP6226334.1 phosphoglycerate kinase [Dehalococcoidia bacterium]MDP7085140.1 phosphoglycerate kinase [Dehalococcoidia bacterium]MDP7202119.1 phosphoglycerate kinase [Dehalococcoidia bacterium]MDP7509858.1 phosphoglycerate kinase [Dehalococcoidia bacterium]